KAARESAARGRCKSDPTRQGVCDLHVGGRLGPLLVTSIRQENESAALTAEGPDFCTARSAAGAAGTSSLQAESSTDPPPAVATHVLARFPAWSAMTEMSIS